MTPIWVFPVYPLLIVAPLAASIISTIPDTENELRISAKTILIAAIGYQGIGLLVSLMIYSAFIYRLMTQRLPQDSNLPGMFVAVGPSGFTATGIVQLGSFVEKVFPADFMGNRSQAALVCRILANISGLWLWCLAIWFFVISVGGLWRVARPNHPAHRLAFSITWYAFVFPNTALVTATHAIGKAFESTTVQIVGTGLATALFLIWLFVSCKTVWEVWKYGFSWPRRAAQSRE